MNNDIHRLAARVLMTRRGWSKVEAEAFAAKLTDAERETLSKLPAKPGVLDKFLSATFDRLAPPVAEQTPDKVRVRGRKRVTTAEVTTADGTAVVEVPQDEGAQ